jgi:hypothetical protein
VPFAWPLRIRCIAQVTQVKARPLDCTTALQIGCGSKKAKRLHNAQKAAYLKKSLPFKAKLVRRPPVARVAVLTSLAAWQSGCIQSAAGTVFKAIDTTLHLLHLCL